MTTLSFEAPRCSPAEAEAIAAERYGLAVQAADLPGEKDRNFLLRGESGPAGVLKVSQAQEDRGWLELEHAALARAATVAGVRVPEVVRTRADEEITVWTATDGTPHLVRLLSFLPGRCYAEARPHDRHLLGSLGSQLARLGDALEGLVDPRSRRPLKWDLSRPLWIRDQLGALPDGPRRDAVTAAADRFATEVAPRLGELQRTLIYNDANDRNVLVEGGRVSGFVDFGDMVEGPRVCDLAIAIAYAMMGQTAPLDAACEVVRGYHAVRPLLDLELDLLWALVRTRLAVSVTCSAMERVAHPENPYLAISEAPAWELLGRMDGIHPRFATCALRAACGKPAHPAAPAVCAWLAARTAAFAPVVAVDPRREPAAVLDLGVGSLDLGGGDRWTMEQLESVLEARRSAAKARLAVGRYLEPRLLYPFGAFQDHGLEREEPRTVHLGADLFLEPGSPVCAPLDGRVFSVADNAGRGDYGPTVILEHIAGGTPFWTLYGHLDPECLERLAPGDPVLRGTRIARVGARPRNGDWTPHVHFQILLDPLDGGGDFPGVARPADLELFAGLCPDPNLILGVREPLDARPIPDQALQERRRVGLGRSLSVSYSEPLHIVRGFMQHLYDAHGRRYLDMVNNVPHVGHGNPRVVAAAARQLAVMNSNTRYLHPLLEDYAEALRATLPATLAVCFFVNSGSEANELALRLARTATGRKGTVVVDAAYHGNTQACIDVSPSKHDGPGGAGAPPWVRKVALPDPYRGPFRGPACGPDYAAGLDDAMDQLAAQGHPAGAFLVESMLGCGGQIVLPAGYLAEAFRRVRARGGLCIADEVQVGFGRAGTHFWAFETQGVVPDIVTLGKPIGNGWPLGAVVTTSEIAAAFANGMEYFNTFGGNPASLAAGLAVLREVQELGLQAQAQRVGDHLQAGLRELQARFPVLGDVRGLGLYLGAELVKDPDRRDPHPAAAGYVADRMRSLGVLVSTDGPDHNVLKIKPPLVVTEADAERLLEALAKVLAEDGARA